MSQSHDTDAAIPSLEDLLRHAVAIGAVLVLLLPAARGTSDTLGWLPMWLLAMPLAAWWALRRLRAPLSMSARKAPTASRRRRNEAQARRRALPAARRAAVTRAA